MSSKKYFRNKSNKKPSFKVQELLASTQNMLEMVINNVPQHIFWKDVNSVFMGCNDNFAKAVGIDNPKDIRGKTDFDLADEDKAKHFIEIDKKVMSNNSPMFNMMETHKKVNGETIWININKIPLRDNGGNVIGVLGTFEDISDRVILEKKMQANSEKYQNLIKFTNTAYMILDKNFNILETNEVFTSLIKCSPDIILGSNPRSWVVDRDVDAFDKAFENVLYGNPINDMEIIFRDKEGKEICTTINANIIENGDRKIFCLIRDISHKKAQEELKFIKEQKAKDKIKQNIMQLRDTLKDIKSR